MDLPKVQSKPKAPKRTIQQENADEPAKKQSKKEPKDILTLNDHCLLEIFKYLPLNDVCSLSQTCRRMHALGSSHFMLNHKAKVMVFIDWLYGNLFTFPRVNQEKYIECFAKSMRSVTLLRHFSTIAAMEQLNKFYQGETKAEAASPIEAIRFVDWTVDVSKAHCDPIAAILKNVKSVTFENTSINADLDGCLFGFMPNLKQLTVLDSDDDESEAISSNSIWMQPACPTLEYFAWHKAPNCHDQKNEFPANEMVRFLKMNPGIKFVSLRLDTVDQFKSLMKTGIQINELFLTNFYDRENEIAEAVKDLKDFCEKMNNDDQSFHLHLQVHGHDFEEQPDQLELLAPPIVGLYFVGYIPTNFDAIFPKLSNLKVLQAREYIPAELLCHLPNLEEIFVSCSARPLSYYDGAIQILGTQLAKLNKLYMNSYLYCSSNNAMAYGDLDDVTHNSPQTERESFSIFGTIDTERKKLAGAQKLKVYLEVEENLRDKKVDYDTVEVLRTQTEAITNPLFRQSRLIDELAAPDRCVLV